jgi:hypothetical protein
VNVVEETVSVAQGGSRPADLTEEEKADLAPELRALIDAANQRRWNPVVRDERRGIRYWCPGPCRHQFWAPLKVKSITTVEKLRQRLQFETCWESGSQQ